MRYKCILLFSISHTRLSSAYLLKIILSKLIYYEESETVKRWKPVWIRTLSRYFQVGISNALTLSATKAVQEPKAQQHLTLFRGVSIRGGTLNFSVNSLNESPTL